MNSPFKAVMSEQTRRYLQAEIDWLLDLLDKERQRAATHSQRNNYQAVVRHMLQCLNDTIRMAEIVSEPSKVLFSDRQPGPDDIPF